MAVGHLSECESGKHVAVGPLSQCESGKHVAVGLHHFAVEKRAEWCLMSWHTSLETVVIVTWETKIARLYRNVKRDNILARLVWSTFFFFFTRIALHPLLQARVATLKKKRKKGFQSITLL